VTEHAFGRFLTLGVEEELMLVDERTLALASGVTRILPERTERLKTELFECVVETTTTVCESAEQVLDELGGLRREVARRAREAGLSLLSAGAHPFSRGAEQEIVPEERYLKMKAELGPAVYRQIVCGLHVHVGMPDPETCLRAFEGVLRWLPELLSLSANSPYLEGEEVGVASGRAGRLAELPRAEAPPVFRSWGEWESYMAGRDYTRMWLDARPHPRLGTLEVRIADQQTDVRRSAAIAALVQALAAEAAETEPATVDRDEYHRRRGEGAAGALPLDGLRAAAEPPARRLGTWQEVEALLDAPAEAERQLAVGRAAGVREVAADVVARTAT
jgi:glutamate---cysteine ligase / carboxylate-amine ligase